MYTKQEKQWKNRFGDKYTQRNILNPEQLDQSYKNKYNCTRKEINEYLFYNIDKNSRILEVGYNIGNQLLFFTEMGYTNLYGIDINFNAIKLAKKRIKNTKFTVGSALDLPYKNNDFDMVFTAGVLIHIAPQDITRVMSEITRVTRRYISGLEYYLEQGYQEVQYREQKNLL